MSPPFCPLSILAWLSFFHEKKQKAHRPSQSLSTVNKRGQSTPPSLPPLKPEPQTPPPLLRPPSPPENRSTHFRSREQRSMEDPKPAPDPTAQASPGQPPLPPQSKKRPLDADASSVQNSKYFKMRAMLGDLRPHFIEVRIRSDGITSCPSKERIATLSVDTLHSREL